MTHEFTVEPVKDDTRLWHAGYCARCECGWEGDLRDRGETCLRDGFGHQREMKEGAA